MSDKMKNKTKATKDKAEDVKTTLSQRQTLSYTQREKAAIFQIKQNPNQPKRYQVPSGLTPDEKDYNDKKPEAGGFPRFAASFHKLLEHESKTGLLTEKPEICKSHSKGGVQNYIQLLDGLEVRSKSSSDFDSGKLNGLELCNRTPPAVPPDPPRPRVLINPRSSKALSIKGPNIASLRVSRLIYGEEKERQLLEEISLGSPQSAAEMIEVYAMALLRETALRNSHQIPDSNDVNLIIKALNSFGEYFVWGYDEKHQPITAAGRKVNRKNLFRGPTKGDLLKDYLSVFIMQNRPPLFPAGCAPHVADLIGAGKFARILSQSLQVPQAIDKDFGLTWDQYVCIQNAYVPELYPDGYFTGLGPLTTARNLGDHVHTDNVYEHYIRAADILVGNQHQRSLSSPYTMVTGAEPFYRNEGDGPTLGPSDAYSLLGGVREVAERASFTQKWVVARRARPEVMAALIDLANRDGEGSNDPINQLRSQIKKKLFSALTSGSGAVAAFLNRVRQWNNSRGGEENFLLAQMYPEGSPAHPSWVSGHATVAGACVTVLKALFNDLQPVIIVPEMKAGFRTSSKKSAEPLDKCQPKLDPHEPTMSDERTVGGELDKLASNISLGRSFGGVHYRSDGEHGILLGEEVAIRYLQDHLREYREMLRSCDPDNPKSPRGLTLTKRNGQRICITPEKVENIPTPPKHKGDAQIVQKSLL